MRNVIAAPAAALLSFAVATAAPAQESEVDRLFDALDLPEMIGIMREEGMAYGETVAQDLFPGDAGPGWEAALEDIYDLDWMQGEVRAAFGESLEGADVGPMIEFFTTEPGSEFIRLEVSAREALLDDEVEQAAEEAAAVAMADRTERFELVSRFAEANDLIETNVVSGMNSNTAFYLGLMEGGAFPDGMSESQILSDVWAQEPQIRESTTEWVFSFLLLAYQPLPDEDLEAYIAFSRTEAGERMNRAIFDAFDDMFVEISRKMGQAAARYIVTEEL